MKKNIPNFSIEKSLKKNEGFLIAGVDEVGRGCIAGPIIAAAVIFNDFDLVIENLKEIRDSKTLTPKKRSELSGLIKETALDIGIGEVNAKEIDHLGIGAANILSFKRALDGLKRCDLALIDGRNFRGFDRKYRCYEKGESKSISIAAASIVAKVYRDNLMAKLAKEFPDYFFDKNMGYGSKDHYLALDKLGAGKVHRKSFLKKFYSQKQQSSLF